MVAVIPRTPAGTDRAALPKACGGDNRWSWRGFCRSTSCSSGTILSDPQAERAIYRSAEIERFARVELGDDVVLDESMMLRFCYLLE
jgi:hypothetical protein